MYSEREYENSVVVWLREQGFNALSQFSCRVGLIDILINREGKKKIKPIVLELKLTANRSNLLHAFGQALAYKVCIGAESRAAVATPKIIDADLVEVANQLGIECWHFGEPPINLLTGEMLIDTIREPYRLPWKTAVLHLSLNDKEYLTLRESAIFLGLPVSYIQRQTKEGNIQALKIPGVQGLRYSREVIQKHRIEPLPPPQNKLLNGNEEGLTIE